MKKVKLLMLLLTTGVCALGNSLRAADNRCIVAYCDKYTKDIYILSELQEGRSFVAPVHQDLVTQEDPWKQNNKQGFSMTKNSHQSCYFANNSKLPIVKGKDFHWLKLPMDQTTAWPKMKTGLEELKDGKKAQLTGHYTSAIDQTLRDAVNHSWLDTLFSTEVAKKSRATFARRIMDIGCGFAIGCLLHRVMAYAWNSLGQTKN